MQITEYGQCLPTENKFTHLEEEKSAEFNAAGRTVLIFHAWIIFQFP